MKSFRTSNWLAMIGGAGIGAGLMYLLDPDAGARRREQLARAAAQSAHGAGQTMGAAWQGIGQTAHHAADTFRSARQSAAEHGRDWAQSLSASAAQMGRSARRHVPAFLHRQPPRRHDVMTEALLVAGALAAGAGLMMLLDPRQGRRRRALIRDKFVRGIHETRDLARTTGRYVADHARGCAAEARSMFRHEDVTDEQLEARVRSELGRVASNIGAIEVSARNGSITLSGIPDHERETVLAAVGRIRGVRDVDCQASGFASGGEFTSASHGGSSTGAIRSGATPTGE